MNQSLLGGTNKDGVVVPYDDVKVVYSYSSESSDEVSIYAGDTIRVLQVGRFVCVCVCW